MEEHAVEAFRKHWADVLRRACRGKPLGRKLWPCFEADTNARRKELAFEFFGVVHARAMNRLSPKQIRRRLSCYLPRAIEYAEEGGDDLGERREFVNDLVTGVYVLFDSTQSGCREKYDEYWEDLSVHEYASGVSNDDWYERSIGGLFTGGTYLLMKSTGERFTRTELEWLTKAIQSNLDSEAWEELWGLRCEYFKPNRIWIKIYMLDRDDYLEGVMGQASELAGEKLRMFVNRAVEYLAWEAGLVPPGERKGVQSWEEEGSAPKAVLDRLTKEIFGDLAKQSDERILKRLGRFLERRATRDSTVREIEGVLNRMMGRQLRDYHCEVSY